MDVQGFIKKYGLWILGGVAVVYLVLRNASGGRAGAIAGANPNALELARLQAGKEGAAGELALRRADLEARLAAERARQEAAEREAQRRYELQRRALDLQGNAAQASMWAQILNAIGGLAKAIPKPGGGGSSGGGGISGGTPTTFPQRSGGGYRIPEPDLGAGAFNPPLLPAWPEPVLSNTFSDPGITFDSGMTFSDQFDGGFWDFFPRGGGLAYDNFAYSESGESEVPQVGESFEEVTGLDSGGYSEDYYGFNWG